MSYLGLGKTLFNSSVGRLRNVNGELEVEIALSERLLRKKGSGAWPERAIRLLTDNESWRDLRISENRDVIAPAAQEDALDLALPFFSYLEANSLTPYARRFNPALSFVSHHLCHASSAFLMSPFDTGLIVVIDGAGSSFEESMIEGPDVQHELQPFSHLGGDPMSAGTHEECSVYLMNQGSLRCVYKRWRKFRPLPTKPSLSVSEGAGIFYETVAKYIFNDVRSSGKVMGLAPLSRSVTTAPDRIDFLNRLAWDQAFTGHGRQAWEASPFLSHYADIAAVTQRSFEEDLALLLRTLRESWPQYDRLILTGGCALNCTFNGKLAAKGDFSQIYVPPFPGDESIGIGAASYTYHFQDRNPWKRWPLERQHGYFGPVSSVPSLRQLEEFFSGYEITVPNSITDYVAELLSQGKIVGWFQGRSESGPRALGNRSILADPSLPGIKDRLNRDVKFRESFRPYGSSCLHEKAHEYFEVPAGFDNPYMSFAVKTRSEWRARLREITHVDDTSRMQTVRQGQNPRFHELIRAFERRSGIACLLNTSLNVMGEPIVETAEDAKNFLMKTPVEGLAIGDIFVRRPG